MKRSLVMVGALMIVLSGCESRRVAAPAVSAAAPANGAADEPRVVTPNGTAIIVEVASNDDTRARGLMFRDSLAADRGMIFLFPKSDVYPFWMKDTLIPLDMLWLDESSRIVHIAANVPPCAADPCPSYSPEVSARSVLELRAGRAAELGLKVGDTLQVRGISNYRVQ